MPIIRTYACEDCNHLMDVVLSMDQVDDPPPPCPMCAERPMRQEFRPFAIGGSVTSRAHALAEDIAAKDYHVGDMQVARQMGDVNKVRYKDQGSTITPSQWSAAQETLQHAVAMGRQSRLKHGNGLDVLQANLKSGAEPDLIAISKQRSVKLW